MLVDYQNFAGLFESNFVGTVNCGIILIRGGHCLWIVKNFAVGGDVILWVIGLLYYKQDNSLLY